MIVDVSFLAMLLLFVFSTVVVTVSNRVVVVLVCVPEGTVVEVSRLCPDTAAMVMRNMVMVVAVDNLVVRMLRLVAFALSTLLLAFLGHLLTSFHLVRR